MSEYKYSLEGNKIAEQARGLFSDGYTVLEIAEIMEIPEDSAQVLLKKV
jgi:transposase-like protein